MSESAGAEDEKPFAVERAKTGRAKCKKCKCPIDQGVVRIAKLMSNPFGDGKMKAWHHLACIFELFAKQRVTTKRIDDPESDVGGWEDLDEEGKDLLISKLEEFDNSATSRNVKKVTPRRKSSSKNDRSLSKSEESSSSTGAVSGGGATSDEKKEKEVGKETKRTVMNSSKDDTLREFRRLCVSVSNANAYTSKTSIVRQMFVNGSEGDGFKSDIILWCKLLLPGVIKRVYNLQSKQLIKLFSRMFNKDEDDMLENLEQGDVAETIQIFFEQSSLIQPSKQSHLTIQEVDKFLDKLSRLTREDEQIQHFKSVVPRCTSNDLKIIIRLIKHDLRITAGAKHILDAVHEDAYAAFQVSRDLEAVLSRFVEDSSIFSNSNKINDKNQDDDDDKKNKRSSTGNSKVGVSLMTPVLPMLAEACKSVDMAMRRCPDGMLSEIKYDGERVQVHKEGDQFRYYSRSLKPVMDHKVNHFKDFIPKAFPGGDDLILDSEIIMIDTNTGKPLPFGSLGVHKKTEFKDANVCLFVFDCLYYNGESLIDKSMKKRREILKDKMKVITNRIMLSEVEEVKDPKDLARMIAKVIKLGLEGLVLKDVTGKYEPGKRHWLKVKKDYLLGGAMADTADLVVLGAWYGTGKKGGMMSVFLMGCYDEDQDRWLTVTKVHTGHDDATLERLQSELKMEKIGKDANLLPKWLRANKPMVPDFVAKDPKKQPVWEITGAEFTNQGVHTADGISIRFPRVTRIRDDKDWKTATSLKELKLCFEKSSDTIDVDLLLGNSVAGTSKNQKTLDSMLKPKIEKLGTGSRDISSNNGKKLANTEPESSAPKRKSRAGSENDEGQAGKTAAKNSTNRRNAKRKIDVVEKIEPQTDVDEESIDANFPSTSRAATEICKKIKKLGSIDGIKSERNEDDDQDDDAMNVDDDIVANSEFGDVRVILDGDVERDRRKELRRILRSLGAEILDDGDRRLATHVIHSRSEVPSTRISEFNDVPRAARHLTESWIVESFANKKLLDPEPFAVTLTPVYCTCPCSHQI